jgi:hypothetical protein
MSPNRSRFVTACQQVLALALVLAALTPAAGVVTLDVVGTAPGTGTTAVPTPDVQLSAYVAAAVRPSKVPTAPVRAHVREVPLTAAAASAGRTASITSQARVSSSRSGGTTITSTPQTVTGFGEVGVTWAHGGSIPEKDLSVTVRTRTDGVWSDWQSVPYDPDHGPDPGSAEARHARPGTEPVLVGKVDDVQIQATTSTPLPPDMKLAVISPGHATSTRSERAAIDTSALDGGTGADSVYAAAAAEQQASTSSSGGADDTASLAAAVFTPQPVIYSRAQWGADESIRDKASLHYGDVHAGFVHHTVNANDYTRAEVPGILRSIYAYHVKSRGWSDIGYNYLVDRFGRIWEGRYGGVDRPVVGAHTLGYNDDSFAASAIGNYQIARPSQAMIQAYATLYAWKLSLHGVDASSTHQWVTSRWFEAINGHRDAAATLCPGQYLYNRIPDIRKLAAQAQRGWSGRQLESDVASTPQPDLVVRRHSDGEAFVIPTGGLISFPKPVTAATGATGATEAVLTPDLTGDDRRDLLLRQPDGNLALRPGTATGGFAATSRAITWFAGKDQIVAPGDLNGDGRNDLAARNPATGAFVTFLQRSDGSFKHVTLTRSFSGYDLVTAAGDLNRDGKADLVARDAAGNLWLLAGTGTGDFAAPTRLAGRFGKYDVISGGGDLTHDGRPDLLLRVRSTGDAYVLPGRGDGTFAPRLGPYSRFASASAPIIGDVAGSSDADVLALSGDDVKVWVNPGTFDLGTPIDTGVSFNGANRILVAGDWDRDGYGDVITRQASGNLILWRGNGSGKLTRYGVIATGFAAVSRLTAVGDMTGDGFPDLIGQPARGVLTLYPGRGTTGLRRGYPAYGSVSAPVAIGVGRWDGDGAPDALMRQGGTLTLLRGNGPGWMHAPHRLTADVSAYDWVIGVSSLRGTGHPDLLVRQKGTGRLYALPGTATGLGAPIYLGDGLDAYDLAG